MKRARLAGILLLSGLAVLSFGDSGKRDVARRGDASEIGTNSKDREFRIFSAPVQIVRGGQRIYVVDSQDGEIRVFSESGDYERTVGRKGQGPGELNSPGGMDVYEKKIYVADSFNQRIQIFDEAGGYLESLRVPFIPRQIVILGEDRIVLSRLPMGRGKGEKLVSCFDRKGALLWERVDAHLSEDAVYDTFRNLIVLNRAPSGGFFVVWKSEDRRILHFDADGRMTGSMSVDQAHAFKKIRLPTRGRVSEIRGFCWDSSVEAGRVYLLAPDFTPERDLGPGRTIIAVGPGGAITGTVNLPVAVKKICVADHRIFAVDADNDLRIFDSGGL
ncbi:MAG TPA: 6-bladed beta-propeller [Candidatus Aminicenantes bacterium]|nr:6-bladed beta-propeller [Candidatus Aminicenantes bacterium]